MKKCRVCDPEVGFNCEDCSKEVYISDIERRCDAYHDEIESLKLLNSQLQYEIDCRDDIIKEAVSHLENASRVLKNSYSDQLADALEIDMFIESIRDDYENK